MDKLRTNRRWTIVGVAALAILGVVPVTSAVTASKADAAVAQAGDGTTSSTAGASCWGIKQQNPSSASGTYWLLTKSMDRPAQFACDMTTDGGGWVLVARGRNGWTFSPAGQGSPATVRTTTDPTVLRAQLAAIRERGYAVVVDGADEGITTIAAPVINAEGEVIVALSITAPSSRVADDQLPSIIDRVRVAALQISHALGSTLLPPVTVVTTFDRQPAG